LALENTGLIGKMYGLLMEQEMIEVQINGIMEKVVSGTTVASVLESKSVRQEMVAVEINGELVQKGKYPTLALQSGDKMEFLHYMAGGQPDPA
jgi:sulfur carrier protein